MLLEQWASSRENWHCTGVLSPLLYPGYKEWDRGLAGHLLIGWGTYSGWGRGRVRQISSPSGLGGETGYTAQKDLKSINNYNMGEGKMKRVCFFHSCIPRPPLVLSALLSLGHYKKAKKKEFSISCCSSREIQSPQLVSFEKPTSLLLQHRS